MLYPARFHQNCQTDKKQLLHGLLVDSADYHPEEELFPEGNGKIIRQELISMF